MQKRMHCSFLVILQASSYFDLYSRGGSYQFLRISALQNNLCMESCNFVKESFLLISIVCILFVSLPLKEM